MIDFARTHIQISHMADFTMNEIDTLIADARYCTALGVEHAKRDKHRMSYQLTADEIADGEWELAAAMVEFTVAAKSTGSWQS